MGPTTIEVILENKVANKKTLGKSHLVWILLAVYENVEYERSKTKQAFRICASLVNQQQSLVILKQTNT